MDSNRRMTSPEEWARIEAILDRAFEVEPAELADFLDRECGGDAELKRRIEGLLAADRDGLNFLDRGAGEWLDSLDTDPSSVGDVRGYQILDEIGRGGMSVVYRAERADGRFDKEVAVKVVRHTSGGDAELARRFQVESRVLASLEHPHIARILDAGTTEHDDPYLVMEFVDGRPITDYCLEERLTVDRRLILFGQVCDAVHHAHQRLVVHRDLKPSNILVARPDATKSGPGIVKLLDFGIAKLLDDAEESGHDRTRTGLFLMTPQYAAPEQIRGETITIATDVYALGLLLYEMLVGEPPYSVQGRSPHEILQTVCESQPARPSTRVTEETTGRHPTESLSVMRSRLRGDLDAIVLKALEKDPARRYSSVQAFATDLERYSKGLPVEAKAAGRLYHASKFVRRHRLGVSVVALLFVLVAGAAVRERLNAERISAERDRADQLVTFLVEMFRDADPAATRGREVTANELLERGLERVETDLDGRPLEQARIWSTIGTIYRNLGLLEDAHKLTRRALTTFEGELGAEHPDVLRTRMELANALNLSGDYDDAEAEMRSVYEAHRSTLGADHELTLESARGLAVILEAQGELEEATQLLEGSVPALERKLGPDHESTLDSRLVLANVLHSAGEWDGAEEQYRAALDGWRRTVGADHPLAMRTYNDLSLLMLDVGRVDEAVVQFEELIAMAERVWGTEHHEYLAQKSNLAMAHYSGGQLDEASQVFIEIHAIETRTLGPDHPSTLNTLNNAAMSLMHLDRHDRAFEMLTKAHDGYARTLGEDHPQTIIMLHNLGHVELLRGRPGPSRDLLLEVHEARIRVLGPGHAHTVLTQIQLGKAYLALGELSAARDLLANAIELSQAAYPEGHNTIGSAKLAYGRCLSGLGLHAEAEPELLGAWEIFTDSSAKAKGEAAEALVGLYEQLGRPSDVERFRREVGTAP